MAHIGEIIEFKNYFDGSTLKGKIRAVDTDSDGTELASVITKNASGKDTFVSVFKNSEGEWELSDGNFSTLTEEKLLDEKLKKSLGIGKITMKESYEGDDSYADLAWDVEREMGIQIIEDAHLLGDIASESVDEKDFCLKAKRSGALIKGAHETEDFCYKYWSKLMGLNESKQIKKILSLIKESVEGESIKESKVICKESLLIADQLKRVQNFQELVTLNELKNDYDAVLVAKSEILTKEPNSVFGWKNQKGEKLYISDKDIKKYFKGAHLKENIESKLSKNPETWWFSFKNILDNNFNINSGVAPLNRLKKQPEVIEKLIDCLNNLKSSL